MGSRIAEGNVAFRSHPRLSPQTPAILRILVQLGQSRRLGLHEVGLAPLDCGIIIFYDTSSPVYHLYSKDLTDFNIRNRGYFRVPTVVKRQSLFPWLLLQVYWHHQSWSWSHG
ncbi:hypothetical protein QQP08_003808 [Theobroma cacao]|nr:hypothetical protein QQP08_003808 [Theobroma cacao]